MDGQDQCNGDKTQTRRAGRERRKQRRRAMLEAMSREDRARFLEEEAAAERRKEERLQSLVTDDTGHQRIAIDLRFDDIMKEQEMKSLVKQLQNSYGSIKKMEDPFQLMLFNCSDELQEALVGYRADRWCVKWHHNDELTDVIPPSELVYLSPDSPNVLTKIDRSKTYVIGGIVDRSRKKGATLEAATEVGVTTARLPTQEYMTERADHILNVNTVISVLMHFQQSGDWATALTSALPSRKQVSVGRRGQRRRWKQQNYASNPWDAETNRWGLELEEDTNLGGLFGADEQPEEE